MCNWLTIWSVPSAEVHVDRRVIQNWERVRKNRQDFTFFLSIVFSYIFKSIIASEYVNKQFSLSIYYAYKKKWGLNSVGWSSIIILIFPFFFSRRKVHIEVMFINIFFCRNRIEVINAKRVSFLVYYERERLQPKIKLVKSGGGGEVRLKWEKTQFLIKI